MGRKEFREKYRTAFDAEEDPELMESARLELADYFEEALEADNKELYSQAFFDLEMFQLTEEEFPEYNFHLLLDTIRDHRFLKANNGWVVFSIFHDDWEKLSRAQKESLFNVLAEVYEPFDNWVPRFCISELIGEQFPPAEVYNFFHRFENSENAKVRLFVPHGYEHAIQNTTEAGLTRKLWGALLRLKQDNSPEVRGEVEESLLRLANCNLFTPKA